MDPASLGIALKVMGGIVTLASTIQQKIDKLDRISNEEVQSARQYSKALAAFSNDVETVTTKINTIMHHGNKASLSALLDTTDGQTSFDRLLDVLKSADDLLNTQERAADALIVEIQKRSRNNRPGLVSLLSDADADHQHFNTTLGSAIAILDDSRGDIIRLSQQFYTLYEIHSQAVLGGSPAALPSRIRGHNPISSLQLSFYDQPFDIDVDKSCALEIAEGVGIIASDKNRQDRYTLAMKDIAERWVDNHLNDSEVTVANLGRIQANVMQNLQKVLNAELVAFDEADTDISSTESVRCAHLFRINVGIKKMIAREKSKRFAIAFCGMVKAGKSLFLNALMGHMILPSDELPATAWPCRVRHVKGQLTARLEIDAAYFQSAIENLRTRKFGAMMAEYQPSKEPDLISVLQDELSSKANDQIGKECDVATVAENSKKREIYNNWNDLQPTTKSNLLKFETNGYRIPDSASGDEHVRDLLAQVNDVVRLCRRMKVELPSNKDATWPLLSIEFEALRDETFEGDFEFVDLPGIGESHSDYFRFEGLARYVADEVNAIIPIVSLKEVSKDEWKQQLPVIIKEAIGRPPELVLCTHLDYVARNRVEPQVANVAKAFWPKVGNSRHRVLCCSSRMGFSASALLRKSMDTKPNFKDIWVENAIEYDCAAKILGAHRSGPTFEQLSFEEWKTAVADQLAKSGLQKTIKRLVTDMVVSSQKRVLIEEGVLFSRQLHKAIDNQHWLLLRMLRSTTDREQAYREFTTVREDFQSVLDEWALASANMQLESSRKLQHSYRLLEQQGLGVALQAVEHIGRSIKSVRTEQKQAETNDTGEVVFYNVADAEIFHQRVQMELSKLLQSLERTFVASVRTLANRSRTEHFTSLKSKIQASIKHDLQPELKEEIIEELSDRGATVQTLAFSSIRRKVMHTIITRHNAASAYRALQATIAKPFLRQRPIDVFAETMGDDGSFEAEEYGKTIEELGFMLRAPIAAIAIVPWVLGSGIWPFMKNSEKYVLNKEAFVDELKKHIIRPFLDALKQEGQNTLKIMMTKSSEAARDAVKDALANEEQRYESERVQKNNIPSSTGDVASVLKTFLNLVATEAALRKLQKSIRDLPLNLS